MNSSQCGKDVKIKTYTVQFIKERLEKKYIYLRVMNEK